MKRRLSSHAAAAVPLLCVAAALLMRETNAAETRKPTIRKVTDLVIYQDDRFYSAFPSVVRRPDGELLVAFRRAPNRRLLGEPGNQHTDPNSQLVLVRSRDAGKTWSQPPELIYAHPFGGSQDPCLAQLRDGTLVCSSYGWALLNANHAARMTNSLRHGAYVFLGGYLLRSLDAGHSWQGPLLPPHVGADTTRDIFGEPVPAYNRGAMCEASDGRLFWAVAASTGTEPRRSETHLLVSTNQAQSWSYACPVATDPKVTFNETSLYETLKGDLLAFMRTANFDDRTVVARSVDGGSTFQPWQDTGWRGHPHHALRLPDHRIFLVYGYRHAPFGIRARVLDAEGADVQSAEESVLRTDGGNADLGYPWATLLPENRVLVVYYFNLADGTRHIAGTVLEVH
ncbi:MAG TPA: sialidase family protein [Verrucomicrobiae bacterium]